VQLHQRIIAFDLVPSRPWWRESEYRHQNQEALGRSRGGFSTKIHLRTNAKRDPLTFDVTGGGSDSQASSIASSPIT
jgi:hypothetical protein